MEKIIVYDFDGTIYDGDSTIDFYKFCIKNDKKLLKYLPKQIYAYLMYACKLRSKEYFKEKFFLFLKNINDVNELVEEFWKENAKNIKKWYNIKNHNNDVIISASPEFLLRPICDKLGVKLLIATIVDEKNGQFLSKNCKGNEKVRRLNETIKNYKIQDFYSDSKTDIYLAKLAVKSYFVNKNKITEWKI